MAALACLCLTMPAGARALPQYVMAAAYYQYVPGQAGGPLALEVERGSSLLFVNVDSFGAHDVIAVDLDEDGNPLFYAPPIDPNQAIEVDGVDRLSEGSYEFWCSVHGADLMSGLLTIAPALL